MADHGFISSSAEDLLRRRVKAELRKRMRGLRHTTPASACAERSARIVERLAAMPELASARAVALFWPIVEKHEVDLRALDSALRARGADVAYPSIDAATGVMTFRFVEDIAALEERGYGFREPPTSAREARADELSAVVVPAIVLDTSGHRVGYGAGYYDRTLPRFAPPAVTVGVAYDFQLVAEVAATASDVAVAWIVTDKRVARAEDRLIAARPRRAAGHETSSPRALPRHFGQTPYISCLCERSSKPYLFAISSWISSMRGSSNSVMSPHSRQMR